MGRGKEWTQKELLFLNNNYEFLKAREIGKYLGRSTISIKEKARKTGLKKNEKLKRKVSESYNRGESCKLEIEGKTKMKNYKFDINRGDKVVVLTNDYNRKQGKRRKVKGKVVYKNNSYLTVQARNYKESFTFSELYCGDAKILKEGQAWN